MCLLFVGSSLMVMSSRACGADRPNIIFLMSDDQTTYSLGCYGNKDVKTPHLDRLARDGMLFTRHYDTTAICMASRANVMTGMYEYKTGCNFNHGPLLEPHWKKTYPMLLRKAGYLTAFAGKFGFEVAAEPGGKKWLPEKDFDWWGGGPGQTHFETAKNKSMAKYAKKYPHATRAYGAFGSDFVRYAAKQSKPFCLSISFKAPHRPVTPDPKFDDVYAGKKFTKPVNYGRKHGEHFSAQSKQGRQYERFHSWDYDKNYDGVMAKYHQQCYAIDVAVGMIRDAIKDAGVANNTVIIYTSDNGFFCGSHGYGSKVLPYEESSRVPLIMFDPRHANSGKQLTCGSLTGNIDFAPTILALAGIELPKNIDGVNLMPLYDDPKSDVRQTLSLMNVWGPLPTYSLSVVTRDWKYVYWSFAEKPFKATEEMYHLSVDPHELKNVAGDKSYQRDLATMRKHYDAAVAAWKKEAVPYHDYTRYGTMFDRHIPWETKRKLFQRRGK